MSENTKIEWADMTWNPWRGCEKVSPGCKFCYAEKQAKRNPKVLGEWGPGAPRVRGVESYLALPAKWNAAAEKSGARPKVFCLSFGDWLDEAVPIEWFVHLLETIRTTPHLDWLLLTKRPENFKVRLLMAAMHVAGYRDGQKGDRPTSPELPGGQWIWDWGCEGMPPANVWVGTSVEDQKRADERIPELLKIPAKVRFLSSEPLLGPIEFSNVSGRLDVVAQMGKKALAGINWVIVGGESGSKDKARVCALEWVDGIRRQCDAAEVACFVKQLGTNPYVENANLWDWPVDDEIGLYCDPPDSVKAFAAVGVMLKHLKGGDWEEWPELLRVREFPKRNFKSI
jgi:protein gp37